MFGGGGVVNLRKVQIYIEKHLKNYISYISYSYNSGTT